MTPKTEIELWFDKERADLIQKAMSRFRLSVTDMCPLQRRFCSFVLMRSIPSLIRIFFILVSIKKMRS